MAEPLFPGALPHPRTRLIGREVERAASRSLLLDQAVPLLNLTGPGGSGNLQRVSSGPTIARAASDSAAVDLRPTASASRPCPSTAAGP